MKIELSDFEALVVFGALKRVIDNSGNRKVKQTARKLQKRIANEVREYDHNYDADETGEL